MLPARRLGRGPGQGGVRILAEHGTQGITALADPVAHPGFPRAGGQASPGQDDAAADGGGQDVRQAARAGPGVAGRGAQRQRQPGAGRLRAGLLRDGPAGQPRPRGQRGDGQIGHGVQVGGQPGPQMFGEQALPRPGEDLRRGGPTGLRRGLAQAGVQGQQGGQVIGFGGRRDGEGPPETRGPVGALAAERSVRAEVDRGVGRAVQHEDLGVLGLADRGQPERARDGPGRDGAIGHRAESAEQLPAIFHRVLRSLGRAKAAGPGLSGRISQRGRRVPSGDTCPAGLVCAIHCR